MHDLVELFSVLIQFLQVTVGKRLTLNILGQVILRCLYHISIEVQKVRLREFTLSNEDLNS